MRITGWAFLIVSWALITGLVIFCFYKMFGKKRVD